ncbi:MAG: hypothetical protein ACJ8F1_19960 [Polyangia bacterium]
MTSPPEETPEASKKKRPASSVAIAFWLAAVVATVVGLVQCSHFSEGGQGAVGALTPVISMGYAVFAWIVTFPSVWLVVGTLRALAKRRADRRG